MKSKLKVMQCNTLDGIKHLNLKEQKGVYKKINGWKFFYYKSSSGYHAVDPKTGVSIIKPQKSIQDAINTTKRNLLKFVSIIDTNSYIDLCDKYKKMKKYVQLEFEF